MGVCGACPRIVLVMVVGKLVCDAGGLLREVHGMRGAKGAALREVRVPAATEGVVECEKGYKREQRAREREQEEG